MENIDFGKFLKPAADVANNLIDKFALACEYIVTPKGKKKDKEEATELLKEEIMKLNLSGIQKAALISNSRKALKEYENRNNIINSAIEMLDEKANPDGLDTEWLNYFFDNAKNISAEDVQIIWSKILAEESNNNGSIPKQLINTLNLMSKEDANNFCSLCRLSVSYDNKEQIFLLGDSSLEIIKLSQSDLAALESLGLLKQVSSGYTTELEKHDIVNGCFEINYWDKTIKIDAHPGAVIPIGYVSLNTIGKKLKEFLVIEPLKGYELNIVDYLIQKGYNARVK